MNMAFFAANLEKFILQVVQRRSADLPLLVLRGGEAWVLSGCQQALADKCKGKNIVVPFRNSKALQRAPTLAAPRILGLWNARRFVLSQQRKLP